jgi:hypothetical protein
MSLHRSVLLCVLCASAVNSFAGSPAIKVTESKDTLDITIDSKPFTTYRFVEQSDDPDYHRPYFFPVLAADGTAYTSDRARETAGQAKREHPWHRSVWVGHGDLNGLDHWSHRENDKKLQRHVKFDSISDNGFVEELAWEGKEEGKPVLSEIRTVKFIAYDDGARAIDVTSKFTAASGEVVFKVKPLNVSGVEAGWLSARINEQIPQGKQGKITSSSGATDEKSARTLPANWCDYSGPIDGHIYGIAELDDPKNPGHPTPFHVRQFGLLTHLGTLNWTLKDGDSQSFHHRLLFHAGDAANAKLDERYKGFVAE